MRLSRGYWCGDEDPLYEEGDDVDEDSEADGTSSPIMPSEFEADFD